MIDFDDWLESADDSEFESAVRVVPAKGDIVTKNNLARILGYAVATIDKMIAEGMPIVEKGARRIGYKINTAAAHSWIVRRAVALATGNEDVAKFDSAKARDKDAQARLREFRLAQAMNLTITRSEAAAIYEQHVSEFRKRLLEGPDQITGLTEAQREEMLTWIDSCLSEFSGLPREGEELSKG